MKKSWQLINKLLGRCSDRMTFPSYIEINNDKLVDKTAIANEFNTHFSTVGRKYASKIPASKHNTMFYMKNKLKKTIELTTVDVDTV